MVEVQVHRLQPLSATIILADGGKLEINYTPAAEEQTLDKSLFDAQLCMQGLNAMIDFFKDQEEVDREQPNKEATTDEYVRALLKAAIDDTNTKIKSGTP